MREGTLRRGRRSEERGITKSCHGDRAGRIFPPRCSPRRRASRSWVAWAARSLNSSALLGAARSCSSTSSGSSTIAAAGTPLPLLRRVAGMAGGTRAWGGAREHVRVRPCPRVAAGPAEALARGELSYAKVRALTRVATPETEARLLREARGTAVHVERIVRGWRRVDRQAEAREAARQHAGRALHVYQDEDGTVVLARAADAGGGRSAPAGPRRGPRDAATSGAGSRCRPRCHPTRPRRPRPGRRSRRPAGPAGRRRCIRRSIPGRRGSGTRSWCTWTPRYWRIRSSPGSRCWRTCAHVPAGTSQRWLRLEPGGDAARRERGGCVEVGAERGRLRRRCGGRCTIATGAAGSRSARPVRRGAPRARPWRRAARPRWRTSCCCVAGITGRWTRMAACWSAAPDGDAPGPVADGGVLPGFR